MPNDSLVESILALTTDVTPSERLVLKLAAALIKQLGEEYDIEEDEDSRIKLTWEEIHALPDRFEILNWIPRPKEWEVPERLRADEKNSREWEQVVREFGGDQIAASEEYQRRKRQRRRK